MSFTGAVRFGPASAPDRLVSDHHPMPSAPTPSPTDLPLTYLSGYSPTTQARVRALIGAGTLGNWLNERYPEQHAVTNDRALYDFTLAIKQRYLRTVQAPSKVAFDDRLERELVIPFGASGYVALFHIIGEREIVVSAIRHQREDDYH
jgi:hypothetical protein